jgi:pimeloyl-ACP methyl ester carboxylesterase
MLRRHRELTVVGYSMGGLVTLTLLARRPERFASAVVGGTGLPRPSTDPQRRAKLAAALEAADAATISEPTELRFRQAVERGGTTSSPWQLSNAASEPKLTAPHYGGSSCRYSSR